MPTKKTINVFWFKRDLRLLDNPALQQAVAQHEPLLLLYVFEPSLISDNHYHDRHLNFIEQSLVALNNELSAYETKVLVCKDEVLNVFCRLQKNWKVKCLYSTEETGIERTFIRDKEVKKWCVAHGISWSEHQNNGVIRGLKNRSDWRARWADHMLTPIKPFTAKKDNFYTVEEFPLSEYKLQPVRLENIQAGGTKTGLAYLDSFLKKRHKKYQQSISKPEAARLHCGRVSPYLAWGNLSVRYVWQRAKQAKALGASGFQLNAFTSRLRWQAHFIQKFEMEAQMEFTSVNKGYVALKKPINKSFITAWEKGNTGYPLVDACMRCVVATGYLNFRMRAMVVSFFTHHLWQPWQAGVTFLASQFLDFEPGIHYPQFQMQAGETGVNMVRIYNPVKNAQEHDPDGNFVRKWVPELHQLPTKSILEPWTMTEIEQQAYNCILGKDYPKPIVNLSKTYKHAATILWQMKRKPKVRQDSKRILARHTLPDRNKIMDA